jgi:hypothetical protein
MTSIPRDHAAEICAVLTDATKLCHALGLTKGAKRQPGGLNICCPFKGEKNPSCSVRNIGGAIRVHCFHCETNGDALTLIAAAHRLDIKTQFPEVLRIGAELAGIDLEADSNSTHERPVPGPRRAEERPGATERPYPAPLEIEALWRDSGPVADDPDASGALVARRIDPLDVDRLGLAVCFQRGIARDRLPRWAGYQGQTWRDTGHRMLVRAYDADGEWRSVRAWRVCDGSSPKRLPPGGHKASGLVLANRIGIALLRGERVGRKVLIVEGEPDHLVRSIVNPGLPVLGVLSGSWHAGFAERMPIGCEVVIRTHADQAGDRYAMQILETIRDRAQVYRIQVEEAAA